MPGSVTRLFEGFRLKDGLWQPIPASLSTGATNYTQDANCVGAWYMNGASDAGETDRTTNGNDLTLSAGDTITQSATVPTGYSGYSRDFEFGESDSLTVADGTELDINGANAKLSIVAWVKVEEIADTFERFVGGKWLPTGNQKQYYLMVLGTGVNTFKFRGAVSNDGSTDVTVDSSTTNYAAGTWYHVAFVSNDTDLRIYVNGSLDCTPTAHTTGIFNGSDAFYLGAIVTGTWGNWDGLMDEVAVFNRDLSSAEVSDIYTNGISGNKGGSD